MLIAKMRSQLLPVLIRNLVQSVPQQLLPLAWHMHPMPAVLPSLQLEHGLPDVRPGLHVRELELPEHPGLQLRRVHGWVRQPHLPGLLAWVL